MSDDAGRDDQVDEWAEWAPGWDDDRAARAYAEAAFGSLVAELTARSGGIADADVLDFGSGTGLLTERLVDAGARSVHAVDQSPAMLTVLDGKIAERRWTTVNTSTDVTAETPSYDLIVASSVCSFLDDYPGTLVRLATLLRQGGVFVQWDWERVPDATDDPHGLGRDEIRSALTAAGLIDVRVDTAFRVPFEDQEMAPLIGAATHP